MAYFVEEDHSLIYDQDGSQFYGILAGKPWLLGRNPMNGICLPCKEDLRPATLEDFEYFRVSPKGHIT